MLYLIVMFLIVFLPLVIIIDLVKFYFLNQQNLKTFSYEKNKALRFKKRKKYNKKILLKKQLKTNTPSIIIDVSKQNLDCTIKNNENIQAKNHFLEPPFWDHSYIYSYDEINYATKEQQDYYLFFKNKFLNEEFIDIKDNTNYAFILYFDLLKMYEKHKDYNLLSEQIKFLGKICPKTLNYSLDSLKSILKNKKDQTSLQELTKLEDPFYAYEQGYSNYNPYYYRLGTKYKEKLNLEEHEVVLLNNFEPQPTNTFTQINECLIAILKQYIVIINELEKKLILQQSSLKEEITYFSNKTLPLFSDNYFHSGYRNTQDWEKIIKEDVYLTIFKQTENSVREFFKVNRKVSDTFPLLLPIYSQIKKENMKELSEEFNSRLGIVIQELLNKFQNNIQHLELKTEIKLNSQYNTRWAIEIKELKKKFKKEEISIFYKEIDDLAKRNKKNPNLKNIFFETYKFIVNHDKLQSLKYYAKYIYYEKIIDINSNIPLPEILQTDEQKNVFKEIIKELLIDKKFNKAFKSIDKIIFSQKKKIELNKEKIKESEQKYYSTVKILNSYLSDEDENKNTAIPTNINNNKTENTTLYKKNSIFKPEISLNELQEKTIISIVTSSFKILQSEIDVFARQNCLFKNQLIDSINEACAEYIDGEVLILEEGDNYIIEEFYYKEILI